MFAATVALLCLASPSQAQFQFSTIDDPLGAQGSVATGVDGNNIVGYYTGAGGTTYGFFLSGSTYTTLDEPDANINDPDTYCAAISGTTIVGSYGEGGQGTYGFTYNTQSGVYQTLTISPNNGAIPMGVSGTNIVGYYNTPPVTNGFSLTGTTYTTVDDPAGPDGTVLTGIYGSEIVGDSRVAGTSERGFLLENGTFTGLEDPFGINDTYPCAVYGDEIVGWYYNSSDAKEGFVYDIATQSFSTVNDPLGVDGTEILGVSGTEIVGAYFDSNGTSHAFAASAVPEPSAIATIVLGALALGFLHRRSPQ